MQSKARKIRQAKAVAKTREKESKFMPYEKVRKSNFFQKVINSFTPQEIEEIRQEIERDINRKYDDE